MCEPFRGAIAEAVQKFGYHVFQKFDCFGIATNHWSDYVLGGLFQRASTLWISRLVGLLAGARDIMAQRRVMGLSSSRAPGIVEWSHNEISTKSSGFDSQLGGSFRKNISLQARASGVLTLGLPHPRVVGFSPSHESVQTRVQYFPRPCTINVAQLDLRAQIERYTGGSTFSLWRRRGSFIT